MQVKLTRSNFVSGGWPNPQVGQVRDVDPNFGQHLCDIGVAEALKIEAPTQVKKSSASQAAPASEPATTKKRGRPSKKSSQSTTDGE